MNEYLKTIIVEDETNNLDLLQYLLEKHCPMLRVVGVAKSIEEAKKIIKTKKPDIVFLDILLDDQLVFKLFEDEEQIPNFQIIFTTAFDEYAIKAIKYNALDYLLKPINISELKLAVNKAIKKHNSQTNSNLENVIENKLITIPSQKDIFIVKESDVLFCSSKGSYTIFKLINGKEYISSKNLGDYENSLSSQNFFRIHHSYIVNLNFLVKINSNYCELINNTSLPIARRRKEELKKILNI